MALQQINTTTFTGAQILFQVKSGVQQNTVIDIYNGHSAAIFIGGSSVTTSGATIGRSIAAAGSVQLALNSNDIVYGISASGSTAGAIVVTYSA